MSKFEAMTAVTECDLLVAFTDLTNFYKVAQQLSPHALWDLSSEHYELVGDIVEQAGGKVVKFIGDASLLIFPAERANEGVLALRRLKASSDQWFVDRGWPCRMNVAAHYGSVLCGPIGTRADKRFDISGTTVMTAATLRASPFTITPQVFRRLTSENRKLFKKHTPPITYIPVENKHRN